MPGGGEGSIFQRKDKTWCGSVSLGSNGAGRRVRRTVYADTKAEVIRKLDAVRNGSLPRAAGVTVGQFVRPWVDGIESAVEPTSSSRTRQPVCPSRSTSGRCPGY